MSNIFFILLLSFNFLKLTPILRAFQILLKQTDCWVIGNNHFATKKISGHKTDSTFQRYNIVTEAEMKSMKWLEEKGENSGMLVARGGIEPPTHGFSVRCSTNWAIWPLLVIPRVCGFANLGKTHLSAFLSAFDYPFPYIFYH